MLRLGRYRDCGYFADNVPWPFHLWCQILPGAVVHSTRKHFEVAKAHAETRALYADEYVLGRTKGRGRRTALTNDARRRVAFSSRR